MLTIDARRRAQLPSVKRQPRRSRRTLSLARLERAAGLSVYNRIFIGTPCNPIEFWRCALRRTRRSPPELCAFSPWPRQATRITQPATGMTAQLTDLSPYATSPIDVCVDREVIHPQAMRINMFPSP